MRVLIFTLLILLSPLSLSAELHAKVDRDTLSANESFKLRITYTDQTQETINTDELEKNFTILSRSTELQSFQENINGKLRTQTMTIWLFTLSPKEIGKIRLPSFQVAGIQSLPIAVQVNKSAKQDNVSTKNVIYETELVNANTLYVDSEAIYKVRIHNKNSFHLSGHLTEPTSETLTIKHNTKKEDVHYRTDINGVLYQVLEREYIVQIDSTGKHTIHAPILQGTLTLKNLHAPGQRFIEHAPDTNLTIKAIPSGWTKATWLPAQNLTIEESWSSDTFKIGVPVKRTIQISAEGISADRLPTMQADNFNFANVFPEKADIYTDYSSATPKAFRTDTIVMQLTEPGEKIVPEIKLPWFNTKTKQTEYATLPARTISIIAPEAHATAEKIPVVSSPSSTAPPQTNYWMWACLLLLSAWIASFVFKLWRKNNKDQFLSAIHLASKKNNAKQLYDALLLWIKYKGVLLNIHTMAELKMLLNKQLSEQIENLEKILYQSGSTTDWNARNFYPEFKNWLNALNKKRKQKKNNSDLPPLYPQG